MSSIDLAAIKALCEKATPGPWLPDTCEAYGGDLYYAIGGAGSYGHEDQTQLLADADFIASARTDVPALIAEVERLRATNLLLVRTLADAIDGLECAHEYGVEELFDEDEAEEDRAFIDGLRETLKVCQ